MQYKDHTVPALDDIASNIIALQFYAKRSNNRGDDHPFREKSDDEELGRGSRRMRHLDLQVTTRAIG